MKKKMNYMTIWVRTREQHCEQQQQKKMGHKYVSKNNGVQGITQYKSYILSSKVMWFHTIFEEIYEMLRLNLMGIFAMSETKLQPM